MKTPRIDRWTKRLKLDDDSRAATHLDICLYYSAGGINMFSGGIDRRGYWVSISPVVIRDGYVTSTLGDARGGRALLEQAPRFNQRRFNDLRDALDGSPRPLRALEAWRTAGIKPALAAIAAPQTEEQSR